MTTAAVIGLGEAGALYARGLRDAGYEVTGYDPFTTLDEQGVTQHADIAAALEHADLVISLVGARVAGMVAEQAIPTMQAGAVYADLNTGSPALKQQIDAAATARGIRFADVAVLAPVPRDGARTALMASGPGADDFRERFAAVGAPVESIGGAAGDAAARKLIRSVFMKGMAGVVLESVNAADQAGCGDWLRGQIAGELSGDGGQLVERLISGSRQHAGRRVHEVDDAKAYLESLGQPAWSTEAAHRWLSRLLAETDAEAGAEAAAA